MRFASVCSGIEAASVASAPFGWEAAWLAEVDVAASAVLAHRLGASAPQFPPEFEGDPAAKKGGRTAQQKREAWHKAAKRIAWGDRITNWGDMTRLPSLVRSGAAEAPDVLVGGTPCQAFSVAGNREGLADPRGGLTLAFAELADAIDEARDRRGEEPCIVMWENVYGVLSSKDNAFGCFLAVLAGEDLPLEPPGGKWTNAGVVLGPKRAVAWRVGDAQYFGVAQRRRRVYVVASARDGFDPAAVLLEWEGVRRDTPPSREAGEGSAAASPVGADDRSRIAGAGDRTGAGGMVDAGRPAVAEAFGGGDTRGQIDVSTCVGTKDRIDFDSQTFVVSALTASDGGPDVKAAQAGHIVVHGTQYPIVQHDCAMPLGHSGWENAALCVALRGRDGGATAELGDVLATCLRASGGGGDKPHVLAPAFGISCDALDRSGEGAGGTAGERPGLGITEELSPTLRAKRPNAVATDAVRRLMPIECERLQGFPDGWTDVPVGNKRAADGPRYSQLGNSWAVPHARWVMGRIDAWVNAQTVPVTFDSLTLFLLAA